MNTNPRISKQLLIGSVLIALLLGCSEESTRDLYQFKIYNIAGEQQEQRMDRYLKEAYLPALERAGIPKVGVFKPIENAEMFVKQIFVWIPFQSWEQFDELPGLLKNDFQYQQDGDDYINASYDNAPYDRLESILLRAFRGMPQYAVPHHSSPPSEQIFELRSYEGATEAYYERKVDMFDNAGEIPLFLKLGFQPVFFGEVISGSAMPNLMYMTTFSDTTSQKEHWKSFMDSPEWNDIKAIGKYKNTVSHIDKHMLHPTHYSGI